MAAARAAPVVTRDQIRGGCDEAGFAGLVRVWGLI
jgi:hypothetical protein